MNDIMNITKEDNGNVTVIALMILVILTLLGISASRTSSTDILTSRNQIPHIQDFYIAEGGQSRESARIGKGDYPIFSIYDSGTALENSTAEISSGYSYDYDVTYKGRYPPPSGYSILHFNRYDYGVTTKGGKSKVKISARYYTIGPKAE